MTLHLIKWKNKNGCTQTFRLVDKVSANWRDFGLILGLAVEQLDAWEEQYRGDAAMCWARVMECWLKGECKEDYPVTWDGLYILLNDAGFSVISEELKNAVKLVNSEDSVEEEDSINDDDKKVSTVSIDGGAKNSDVTADEASTEISQEDMCKFGFVNGLNSVVN